MCCYMLVEHWKKDQVKSPIPKKKRGTRKTLPSPDTSGHDNIIKMIETGEIADIKLDLEVLKQVQKKHKVEKRTHVITGKGSEVSSLSGHNSFVSKMEVPLEEFDSFPSISGGDGNLLEINPHMKRYFKFKGGELADTNSSKDLATSFISSRDWINFTKQNYIQTEEGKLSDS